MAGEIGSLLGVCVSGYIEGEKSCVEGVGFVVLFQNKFVNIVALSLHGTRYCALWSCSSLILWSFSM